MSGDNRSHLKNKSTWMRLVHMIVLAIAFSVAELVIGATVLFQFLSLLFTGKTNDNAKRLGAEFADYLRDIVRYMTFVSEERPFPYAAWGSTQDGNTIITPPPSDNVNGQATG